MFRPLGVVILAAAMISALCLLILRKEARASMVAAWLALLALEPLASVAVAVFALVWAVGNAALRRLGRPQFATARILSAARFASAVLLAVSCGSLLTTGAVELPKGHAASSAIEGSSPPNIYVILLDGHARGDTLKQTFGYDDQPFAGALLGLGFDVYGDSTSNYNATLLTLLSMFEGAYVEDLSLTGDPVGVVQTRKLRAAWADAPIPGMLHGAGYTITAITPPVIHVTFVGADRVLAAGGLTDLEMALLASSGFGKVLIAAQPDFIIDSQRTWVTYGLNAIEESPQTGPQLVFAHLMVPHPPFLFDRSGARSPLPACFPEHCHLWEGTPDAVAVDQPDYRDHYVEQVEWVDGQIVEALATLTKRDPNAIVILMGDHGSRLVPGDPGEQFRNLFAARTPGHPRLFGGQPTLVNVFPVLLNEYLGLDLDVLAPRHYFTPNLGRLMETEPWP